MRSPCSKESEVLTDIRQVIESIAAKPDRPTYHIPYMHNFSPVASGEAGKAEIAKMKKTIESFSDKVHFAFVGCNCGYVTELFAAASVLKSAPKDKTDITNLVSHGKFADALAEAVSLAKENGGEIILYFGQDRLPSDSSEAPRKVRAPNWVEKK